MHARTNGKISDKNKFIYNRVITLNLMAKKTKTEIELPELEKQETEIPQQHEFYKIPARFGAVPVDEAPMGYEVETRRRETKITKFEHAYPKIFLPFQEVQRVEFSHGDKFEATELFPTGANRLFFGDNLHIMRQMPSNSIDLIYIDPPFFSGKFYNVIFGDNNEVRSFSDIWEDGMPGYLIWLNARLFEMKRILKKTGSIYVHLDWHASHYVKVEMDKIFGSDNFRNEIVWHYTSGGLGKNSFGKKHDIILFYTKTGNYFFKQQKYKRFVDKSKGYDTRIEYLKDEESGREYRINIMHDTWTDIGIISPNGFERIGYPTQKPEALLERIIKASTAEGDVVADFFGGGGTTAAVAQKLNRRWITSDQSRIAVSIISDRLSKNAEKNIVMFPIPDFTVEHCGIYETPKLEKLEERKFREFIVEAYGGKPESVSKNIHGTRQGVPLYVGDSSRKSAITKEDVAHFASAIFKEKHDNFGAMLAWNFDQSAKQAAAILAARENKRIDFVRLNLVRLEDNEFRAHITSKHSDYKDLLSFIQPPEVRIESNRIKSLVYEFDVSESVSLNPNGAIANVQWDFKFKNRFTSTEGYAFLRDKGKPILKVQYIFPKAGTQTIACSVQDSEGGEKTEVLTIDVS